MPEQLTRRVVVVGDADACAHAVHLWRQNQQHCVVAVSETATTVLPELAQPTLFGDHPALIVPDTAKWNKDTLTLLGRVAGDICLCVETTKKLTAAQTKKWAQIAKVENLDTAWVRKQLLAVFADSSIKLHPSAKKVLSERHTTLAKARSAAYAAKTAGLKDLDDRKLLLLIGETAERVTPFAVVDAVIDSTHTFSHAETTHLEPVVVAGLFVEALRGLTAVADMGVTGADAATVAGVPPFRADAVKRRMQRLKPKLEKAFETACDLDVRSRTERLTVEEICAIISSELAC